MRKNTLLLLLFAFVFNASFSQIEKKQYKEEVSIPVNLDYLLYTPKEYRNSKKDYPLIVFLHGAGERGTDVSKVKVHGPLNYIEQGNNIDALIVAPQCPENTYWQPHQVAALVKSIMKTHRVEASRVYLTGLSMGGYGTWAVGGEYPELFAAMAPVCGAIYRPIYRNAIHLKNMPIWIFHGALDDVVLPENSNKMVMALQQAGNKNLKYTVYPYANHNSWTETYNNQEFYKWLLNQKQ